MTNEKISAKENLSNRLKQEGYLEYVITTSLITLLTIFGVFMSHYSGNNFINETKGASTAMISINPEVKTIKIISTEKIDAKLYENKDISSVISATPNKTKTHIIKSDSNSNKLVNSSRKRAESMNLE